MAYVTDTVTYQGESMTVTWIPTNNLSGLNPLTQAYGICVEKDMNCLIVKGPGLDWCLPGGTIEKGERPHETLVREIKEEADVEVEQVTLLGAQKVEIRDKTIYQSRFVCKILRLLPQTAEPDTGKIWTRELVPFDIVNTRYLKWGKAADQMFNDAKLLVLLKKLKHLEDDSNL